MPPKPITFDESRLPASKVELKSSARQPDTGKTAPANDTQNPNGRARQPIVDRIAANNTTGPVTPSIGIKPRNPDKPKQSASAVSPSAKTDTSNSHQPRENQPWINKMKRPSSDGLQPRETHSEDRKRQKSDQHPSAGGPGARPVLAQKARPQQQEVVKLRGDGSRAGGSQFLGTGRGSLQVSAREDSAAHMLESGVKVTRSQPRSNVLPSTSKKAAEHKLAPVRSGTISEPLGPAVRGSTAWHTVVEQLREQAVQETDRALADASDHLQTLLVEKINELADLCGFVAQIGKRQSGEIIATFKHASKLNTAPRHLPLEVPDSPSSPAEDSGQSPQAPSEHHEPAATSPLPSPSPPLGPIVERVQLDHLRQDKRAVPLSARIERGHEAQMSFHRRGERETPPLPMSGRDESPDDVEEVKHGGPTQRDRARLPSPPRGGRYLPMHPPAGRRRDDRGPHVGVRLMSDVYHGEMPPPRGPMAGRGWGRDPGRRGGRGHDQRGGYHHDHIRRNQRR